MPRKRCHWYDQYGQPRQHVSGTLGCTDPKRCSYAHPNDSDWDVARKSGPPPPGSTISAPHSHRQSRPSPLHSSPGGLLASRIAPRVSREPGELDGSERRSENSPTLSSISLNFNEPPRPGDSSRHSRGSRKPSSSTRRSSPSRPLSHTVESQRTEPSRSEKMQTWVERIKLLSEAVMLRAEHLEMERDLHNYHQLSSLWKYNDVPGGARSDFKADVSSLQDSCIAKKKELTAIVHRLVDTNYWHVTPPTSDDLLVHRMDMQSSINQLRDNVQELFGQLRSLETKSMPPPPNVKPENQEDGGRPAKRRRLSEEVSLPVASSSSTLVGPLMQPLDSKEVAGLTEQVMKLEERIADLENELVVHDNNILMETEEIMTIKMEEWEQKHIPPLNRGSLGPLSESPEETLTLAVNSDFSGRLQILEDDFMRTGEEVGVVIDEVANLITGSDQTQRELVHLREENAQLKDKISLLEERQEENRQTSAKHEAEIKALSAAVTAFLATANAAPPPPPLPTSQEFLLASYPNILQSIQEDLRPVVVDIHRQVEEMLQNHSQELSTTVMNKLALTLKSVHAFSEWVEKNEENVPHVISGVNGINGHSKPGG